MKKCNHLLLLITFILWSSLGVAQKPQIVTEKEIPKILLKKFKEQHPNAVEAKWFPFPYRFGKESNVSPFFFPVGWDGNPSSYFEVRFNDNMGEVRKVYDRGGVWKVTSRPQKKADLPVEIDKQLNEKGYDSWELVSLERISKNGIKGRFYKVWLTQNRKKRILYFDESFKLAKTLKWDNDLSFTQVKNVKLRSAPGYTRLNKSKEVANLPDKIKINTRKKFQDIQFTEWYVNAKIYEPFLNDDSGYFYYDVELPVFHEIIFFQDKVKYKALYNSAGDIMEISQIISTEKLPKTIKASLKDPRYAAWNLEKDCDKIQLENGSYVYRLFGTLNDSFQELTFDEQGNIY